MIKVLVFDWGDTLMKDSTEYKGPMAHWPIVQLMPNVNYALKNVSKKYICCIASNAGDSDIKLMNIALERVGINGYFKYMFTSRELGFKKPEQRFYSEIINRIGYKAEDFVMIGNDYFKDIKPAKEVGMKTILYTNRTDFEFQKGIDYEMSDMIELDNILNKLNAINI